MNSVGIFWDQSFLWGLFVYDALCELDISFKLLRTSHIHEGSLSSCSVLIMPGGWASQKIDILGSKGRDRIVEFVHQGGTYIGFCGGAGIVLSGKNTFNIIPIRRTPIYNRLPSASGGVVIKKTFDHPAWDTLPNIMEVSIWWPSQVTLDAQKQNNIKCVATYESTGKGFWVSDIPYEDVRDVELEPIEKSYGINLDPSKYLIGKPAIMEYCLEKGTFFLSYPHLETPGDIAGRELFRRIISHSNKPACPTRTAFPEASIYPLPSIRHLRKIRYIREQVEDLIEFGMRHFLWFWRKPWMLGWKRGIRGVEYSMLYTLLRFLERSLEVLSSRGSCTGLPSDVWDELMNSLEYHLNDFCPKARHLLLNERFISMGKVLPKLGPVDHRIDSLRAYLFGLQMNHGGVCRKIFDLLDEALYHCLSLLIHNKVRTRFNINTNDFITTEA